MKVLFLTPQLPYPAISGGLIKTLKMIQYLSHFHDVEVGFFLKEESPQDLNEFKKDISEKCFYEKLNRERSAVNFLKSLFRNKPLSVFRNESESFAKICAEKAAACDVIFIDHFLMFQYVPQEWKKKVILHQHNAEFLMWERFAETQSNFLKKELIRFESKRIRSYEKKILEKSSTVLASPNDKDILEKIVSHPVSFVETLHLGEDYLLEEQDLSFAQTSLSILYIGTLTWEANKDGLLWFLKNVWPEIKRKFPQLKLEIIGKENDPYFFAEWKKDNQIIWHGFVEDLKPFYNKSRLFIAPLNFGSGIKVKVVNAIYRGLPTVTTSIGVEGLILKNRTDIFIADKATEQISAIEELLTDQTTWEKLARNSREMARRHYSWDGVLSKINEAIVK